MPKKLDIICAVPTNIITGFLGAGKTSTILQLLKNKPKEENWAVLVNEFGEIGIDGALIEGQYSEQQGVYIREVPGGCMCCTAGLPMRVALSQLLRRSKPDRLLIEPTGLGHPKEIMQTLNDENFRGIIAVQKTVTLIDARHLSDSRYLENETFKEQIAIADIVVGNKQDLYNSSDKVALEKYLQEHSSNEVQLVFAEQGNIEPSLLDEPKEVGASSLFNASKIEPTKFSLSTAQVTSPENNPQTLDTAIPECGFIKALNKGEGFVSVGWRFAEQFEFDYKQLFIFLNGIQADRLKATFITNNGNFGYNLTPDALTEIPLEQLDESRIEIITNELSDDWEQDLFDCQTSQSLKTLTPTSSLL